jgi:CRP-like cAMP-binding protein
MLPAMQRKVISLSRETVLWEAGDAARTVAVVGKGKLGARTERGLVGIILPNMVLGETALLGDPGKALHRTVTVFALEQDTLVMEYPAAEVRAAFDGGDDELMRQVVRSLVGQIARNLLMVVTARRGHPFVDEPLLGLLRGIVRDMTQRPPIQAWDSLLETCRFLADLRDMSDRLLDSMGPEVDQRGEMLVNASQMLAQMAEGQDIRPVLEAYLEAEKEKTEWWLRGR